MKRLWTTTLTSIGMAASIMTASATHITGNVACTGGLGIEGVIVDVVGTNDCVGPVSLMATTDAAGNYAVDFGWCDGTYLVTLEAASLPSDAVVSPPGPVVVTLNTSTGPIDAIVNFTVDTAACNGGMCWLTGGGAKIDPLLDIPVAHAKSKSSIKTPDIAFGGNVNPACSALAGDGGNWNHVDRNVKLHFQGKSIQVVDCGNVTPPPPPGSTSPVTPFNFIEFAGTGTLKGIGGNKADFGAVYFFARCEDRNEPGSSGANDGALVDRYYIRVYTNPSDPFGSTVYKLGGDDIDPANDVVPITDGNLQMHIKPCP